MGHQCRAIQPPHSLDRSYHQPDSTCRCVATESEAESIITGKIHCRVFGKRPMSVSATLRVLSYPKSATSILAFTVVQFA